jgi:hypothetical protein
MLVALEAAARADREQRFAGAIATTWGYIEIRALSDPVVQTIGNNSVEIV